MGGGGLRIREGTMRDVVEMTRQRHVMFEDMGQATADELRVHDMGFPGWVRKETKAKRFVCFLVETDDGNVVGGGSLWLREVQPYPGFPGGKVPYLMSMFTNPKFRGRGVGTMVVKGAISWSKHHGYPSITLHASRKGRRLYKKMGWERTWEMELDL